MFVGKNDVERSVIKNKFFTETSWSVMAKAVAFLFYFLLNVYLARVLGVDKFGEWSFFYSMVSVAGIVSFFGVNTSGQKYIAEHSGAGNFMAICRDSLKLRFLFSAFFSVLIFFAREHLAEILGRPDFSRLFAFAAPLVFFMGFTEFVKSVSMGLHRLKYHFIVNFAEFGLKLLLTVVFLTVSFQLASIVNAFTAASFLAFALGVYFIHKDHRGDDTAGGGRNFTAEILKYSLPLFVISIGFLIATEIDVLMLGLLSSDEQVGLYAVVKQVVGKLPHISVAVAIGTMPVFARLNRDNRKELSRLFDRLIFINSGIFILVAAVILIFSGMLVPLVFGSQYSGSVLPLKILTVFLVSSPLLVFFGGFLNYQGLAWRRAAYLGISTAANITLNIVLIPLYGAVGAAISTSLAYLPYVLLSGLEVRKRFRSYA